MAVRSTRNQGCALGKGLELEFYVLVDVEYCTQLTAYSAFALKTEAFREAYFTPREDEKLTAFS